MNLEQYKKLPKSERECFGFYKDFKMDDMWEGFEFWDYLKEKYPIQFFFRNELFSFFSFCFLMRKFNRVKTWVKDPHRDIRRCIPRGWCDLDHILEKTNAQILISFYHEANQGMVDYDSDEPHREFKKWLDSSYLILTKEIPDLEKENELKYSHETERKIYNIRTKVFKEMIEKREFFWT